MASFNLLMFHLLLPILLFPFFHWFSIFHQYSACQTSLLHPLKGKVEYLTTPIRDQYANTKLISCQQGIRYLKVVKWKERKKHSTETNWYRQTQIDYWGIQGKKTQNDNSLTWRPPHEVSQHDSSRKIHKYTYFTFFL